MFKIISMLVVISQCCSPPVLGSPVKEVNNPHYIEVEMERLKLFAEDFSKTFNTSVEPCDDYIGYVNGHGQDSTPELHFAKRSDSDFMEKIFMNYLKGSNNFTSTELKAKSFYESCHNNMSPNFLDSIKNLRTADMDYLPPGVADWNSDKIDVAASLATFDRLDVPIIFGFSAEIKDGNRSFYLWVGFQADPILRNEPEDFNKVFEHFGYTNDEISSIKSEIADFDWHFQNIGNSIGRELVTVGWIIENFPEFDWTQYFDIVSFGIIKETDMITVNKDQIKAVIELISSTDKKTISNYIFYRFVRLLLYRHKDLVKDYNSKCLDRTTWFFTDVFINIVLKKYLDDHDVSNYVKATENVLKVLKDENIDKLSLRKHNEFMKIITDTASFERDLENRYKNIQVSNNDYFANELRLIYADNKTNIKDPFFADRYRYIMKNLIINHNKPRLFMDYHFIKELIEISPAFRRTGEECIDLVTLQKKFKDALTTSEYLKESNEEIFENEKPFLEKYELNHKKVLLKILTDSFIAFGDQYTTTTKSELEHIIFSLDEFFTEYKCSNEKLVKLDKKLIGQNYCFA